VTVEDGVTETISKQSNVGVGEAIEIVELTVEGALERVKDIFEAIVGDCVDEALDDNFDEAFDEVFDEFFKESFDGAFAESFDEAFDDSFDESFDGIFNELIVMRDSALRRRVVGTMMAGGFGGGCLSSENGRCGAGKKDIRL
jgi:hypothetical protein